MVSFSRLPALLLAVALGGCSLAPGLHIPDSRLEYQKQGAGWRVENNMLVYGGKAPEPIFKVTLIDAATIAAQERAITEARREICGAARPDDLRQYEYRVGPQDVLSFIVWDHPELTSASAAANAAFTASINPLGVAARQPVPTDSIGHRVSRDGTIFFPYAGEIKVAGLTLEEIRRKVTSALSHYVPNPQVDVKVSCYRSKKVYVSGEVKTPGTVYITDVPLTVADAISVAQGLTSEADLTRVRLTRGSDGHNLNLVALYDDGDLTQNWVLQDGDILNVPDRKDSKVFIMGEVKKPDVLFMRKGRMVLSESISLAGGLDQNSADAKRVFVIRGLDQKPDSPLIYRLDLSMPDALLLSTRFELKAFDVVYVSTADVTRWGRVLSQILPTISTLSSSAYYMTVP